MMGLIMFPNVVRPPEITMHILEFLVIVMFTS